MSNAEFDSTEFDGPEETRCQQIDFSEEFTVIDGLHETIFRILHGRDENGEVDLSANLDEIIRILRPPFDISNRDDSTSLTETVIHHSVSAGSGSSA